MPVGIRDAFTAMLPRLQAEDELRFVMATAAGASTLTPSARRRYLAYLERMAQPQRRRVRTLQDLAQSGIRIVQSRAPSRG